MTGSGSLFSNGNIEGDSLIVGQGGSSYNAMTIANGGRVITMPASAGLIGGSNGAGSNNVATVTDTGSVWSVVNTALATGGILVGWGGQNNQLIISNGASVLDTNTTVDGRNSAFSIGGAAGGRNNNVTIIGPGSTLNNLGTLSVGSVAGAGFNTLTGINATVSSAGLTIGTGNSSNNTVYLDASTWNFNAVPITIGSSLGTGVGGATGNQLTVSSAGTYGLTNIGGLNLFSANTSLFLSNRNLAATLFQFGGGDINLGAPGLGGNTVTLSNQIFKSFANSTIGNNSSNNSLTILAGVLWNGNGFALTNDSGSAANNPLTINGGTLTNFGPVIIGNNTALSSNTVSVLNGGQFFSSSLTLGNVAGSSNNTYLVGGPGAAVNIAHTLLNVGGVAGADHNTMIVTNASVLSTGLNMGMSSSNTVQVLAGTTWNMNGGSVSFGTNQTFNNSMTEIDGGGTANGAIVSNFATLYLGTACQCSGASFATLVVTNGAKLFGGGATVGADGSGNQMIVAGGPGGLTSTYNATGGGITIGYASSAAPNNGNSSNNVLLISTGGIVTNSGPIIVGFGLLGRTAISQFAGGAKWRATFEFRVSRG